MLDGTASTMYTHAIFTGLVYTLVNIIGPDHLGTLMALTTLTTPQRAFRVGLSWAMGHCLGMVLVGCLLLGVDKLAAINVEAWEHWGDYFIGVSMVVVGVYFILRESHYLQEMPDGTHTLKPCACHGSGGGAHAHSPAAASLVARPRRAQFCSEYSAPSEKDDSEDPEESAPLIEREISQDDERPISWHQHMMEERNLKGAVLGICQGVCCPMGLVGLSFLASLPVAGLVAFMVTFVTLSSLGTACLAMLWAHVTRKGIVQGLQARLVYRFSCAFTLALGIVWLVANLYGVLDKVDYTAALHHHEDTAHPAESHQDSGHLH